MGNEKYNKEPFWGIKHLPNAITCLNLFSGCIGVWLAFNGNYVGAAVAIILSGIFDFLDGMVARMVNAYSNIGKELDSLADVVSFGLVPGAMVFSLLSTVQLHNYSFLAFLIPIFSALRLAKFNVDERQSDSFIGLPVPANALFWAGLVVSCSAWLMEKHWALIALTILFSYLLVSELPMFSLKFKNLTWKDNQWPFIFLGVSILLIIILRVDSIAPIIIWYILLSAILFVISKRKKISD